MRLFIVVCLMTFVAASAAYACKCLPPNDTLAQESYMNADIVVYGQAILVSKGWNGSGPLASLRVDQVFKGNVENAENLIIRYNATSSACGLYLEEGRYYTLGLYSLASGPDEGSAGVGEYRTMNSCEQSYIEFYLNEKEEK